LTSLLAIVMLPIHTSQPRGTLARFYLSGLYAYGHQDSSGLFF